MTFFIFWDHNLSQRHFLLSWINISMTNQAHFKWILTPQMETIFSNWLIFQNSFEFSWTTWSGKIQVKNNDFSELFTNTFFEITSVTLISNKSLNWNNKKGNCGQRGTSKDYQRAALQIKWNTISWYILYLGLLQ